MPHSRGLTELEGAVLGTIRQKGPCTTYAVRRVFRSSSTPYWSGSAGAIYPAVARLARRRLVRATRHPSDGRGGVLYVITAAGERALRRWLGPPFSPLVVGPPPDPVRTRVNFLGLLPAAERAAFLAAAAEAIAAELAQLATTADTASLDEFDRLALGGSLRTMAARLAWVREGLPTAGDRPAATRV